MIKLKYMVGELTGNVIKKLLDPGDPKDPVNKPPVEIPTPLMSKLLKFVRVLENEFAIVRPIHARLLPKMIAGDVEAAKEWNDFLETEVDVEPMPFAILSALPKLTVQEYVSVEHIFTPAPEPSVTEADLAPEVKAAPEMKPLPPEALAKLKAVK